MTISRRPARKSEPNLNAIRPIDASPRCLFSAAGGATGKRRRPWFWRTRMASPMTTKAPSSFASPTHFRPSLRRLLHEQLAPFVKRRSPMQLATLTLVFLYILLWWISFIVVVWVGPRGSIKGGQLGYIWDQYGRDYTRYQTITKWRDEVRSELGIPIVWKETEGALLDRWFYPFDGIIKTRPNYAVVEMLLREKRRVQRLASMLRKAYNAADSCSRDDKSLVEIPTALLQLLPHHEQPPLPPYWIARSSTIDIDVIGIHNTDINPHLRNAMKNCQTVTANAHPAHANPDLLCMAYHLGGMQLSNSWAMHQSQSLVTTILSWIESSKTNPLDNNLGGGHCNSRVGYAVFSNVPTPADQLRKTSAASSRVSTIFAAFPPDHPASICIPPLGQSIGISPYNQANQDLSAQSTFVNKLITEIESRNIANSNGWAIATLPCDFENVSENEGLACCSKATVSVLDSIDSESVAKHLKKGHQNNDRQHHMIFTSSRSTHSIPENKAVALSEPVSVEISEQPNSEKPTRRQKESIQMELRNTLRCEPSWFCNRCLQSSIYGSFSSCTSCSKCAVDAICNERSALTSKEVNVNVQVAGLQWPSASGQPSGSLSKNRIPRIIHQTYFDEITIDKYPQLFRLQNTWRASGWEYRFYTDDTARQYIEANFPPRFVAVFNSLMPGAYKADFFRYLILYKEGGIYVDVDVMLNTNLDSFITPDLAFFAPIDAVGSFADETYCIWNGLLGSAPAHPALTNVIEWMVNLVSSRGDMYDMERAVCGYSGVDKIENWKVRAEPGLMLSGPCALGLAVNNALGNEPLAKFRAGLLKREGFNTKNIQGLNGDAIGNVMILVADKDDLGAFRFSDPERNIMIASTDLPGLSKAPMVYERGNLKRGKSRKQKPHYSVSTRGEKLWGTHDVYADEMVEDERISITVSYK